MLLMLGFNWIDAVIILLLIGAVAISKKVGFLRQACTLGGFFAALFLGGWLFPHLLPIHDRTLLTLINANLVLLLAICGAMYGFKLGQHVHWSLGKLRTYETALGILPGILTCLVLVWLLSAMVSRLPFAGLSNSTGDALIVQSLDRLLPAPPAVFAEFDRQVNPNAPPHVFASPVPQASFAYSEVSLQAASTKASASVVRITSFGCGGLVTGSGFVVSPQMVATNAHVIAGVKRPIIKYGGRSYEGVPVFFDSNLDFAILRTPGLLATPLPFSNADSHIGTTVAAVGYPGGNYVSAPGIVRNSYVAYGRNIYDIGVIGRDVYEVQTTVDYGSSGGPVVLADGHVVGILFSKSDTLSNYAYALNSSHLVANVHQAEKSYRRVSTGVCLAS